MKATLKFDLNKEMEVFDLSVRGFDLSRVIWNLDNWLRRLKKYEDKEKEEVKIEDVRGKIRELLDDHGINRELVL